MVLNDHQSPLMAINNGHALSLRQRFRSQTNLGYSLDSVAAYVASNCVLNNLHLLSSVSIQPLVEYVLLGIYYERSFDGIILS